MRRCLHAPSNVLCRIAASAVVAGSFSGPLHGSIERDETQARPPQQSAPPLAPPSGTPSEPDTTSAINGFLSAREWLSALATPPTDAAEAAIPLPGVRGVSAIVRHEGRIVGVGEDWPGTVGDDRMLRRAMQRAIAEVVGDEVIRNLPDDVRAVAGTRLVLELEFAGRPEPLLGRTIDECAARVDRGLDGIALRRGQAGKTSWVVAFPGRSLASNTARSPATTITRLVRESGLPERDLPDLARIEPVGLFRFTTLRLAQSRPNSPPAVRGRGIVRVVDAEVTSESVRAYAMAALRRLTRTSAEIADPNGEPLGIGLFGTYAPARDAFDPLVAPAADQAFAAWAAAAVAASRHFSDEEREEAKAFAIRLLEDLVLVGPTESQPLATVPAMVGVACALRLLENDERLSPDAIEAGRIAREKLADRLLRGTPSEQPLIALPAAMLLGTEDRLGRAEDVRKVLDAAWASTEPTLLVSNFSWLVLAETLYSRATGEPLAQADKARSIARALFAVQAGFAELAGEPDLRGGFRLTGDRRAGVTSQSLRPTLGLAAMVGFPGYVASGDERLYRDRLIAAVRFRQELTITSDMATQFRSVPRTEGGVREALWDSELMNVANALAILVDVAVLEADPWHPPAAPTPDPAQPTAAEEPDR
jgi:hypothetical protein